MTTPFRQQMQRAALAGGHPGAVASYFTSGERILHGWTPPARRADDDVKMSGRIALARAIQGIHNSGFLAGAIDVFVGLMVGSELKLNSAPDAIALGWSPDRAASWAREVEKRWRSWSGTPLECDASGKMTIGQMSAAVCRGWFAHGEILASIETKRHPAAQNRTKIQVLDPLTLPRTSARRDAPQSIVHDQHGMPLSYIFKQRREPDNVEYDSEVVARSNTGRPLVIHIFDGSPGQRRGISVFAPALRVVRQFDQLADATLTAALIQTIFAAALKSTLPAEKAFEALQSVNEGGAVEETQLGQFQVERAEWYKNARIDLGEHGRIASLYPTDELQFFRSEHPNGNYDTFSKGLLREIARCVPMTYESFSGDYRGATYSSVRMAVSEHWPVVMYRRKVIAAPFYQAAFEAWLEEEVFEGRITYPGGYPAFRMQRASACKANWRGPARPTADDLKTTKAQLARVNGGISTREAECAENGYDWEEVFEQLAAEKQKADDLGLVFADAPINPADMMDEAQQQQGDQNSNG